MQPFIIPQDVGIEQVHSGIDHAQLAYARIADGDVAAVAQLDAAIVAFEFHVGSPRAGAHTLAGEWRQAAVGADIAEPDPDRLPAGAS